MSVERGIGQAEDDSRDVFGLPPQEVAYYEANPEAGILPLWVANAFLGTASMIEVADNI